MEGVPLRGNRGSRGLAAALLAVVVAAGAAIASLSRGEPAEPAPTPIRPVETDRPAATFAPLVRLHPRERYNPIAVEYAFQWGILTWEHDGCGDEILAYGRGSFESLLNPRHPLLDPAKLASGAYRARPRGRRCSGFEPVAFATDQHTRPHDEGRPAGIPEGDGFLVNITPPHDSAGETGPLTPLHRSKVYFDLRRERVGRGPGLRIDYWLLFEDTLVPGDVDKRYLVSHEGGWERIGVLLSRAGAGRYLPVAVRYHVRGEHRDVPWADVGLVDGSAAEGGGTHPVAILARGSHAPYPEPGRYPYRVPYRGRHVTYHDEVEECDGCRQLATWRKLVPVREEPWYGFGGAWGVPQKTSATSGPIGPSPFTP